MRAIINISLPSQMAQVVDEHVLENNYSSRSEFLRELVRDWMESRIAKDLSKSRNELKQGKGKLLNSLNDLR